MFTGAILLLLLLLLTGLAFSVFVVVMPCLLLNIHYQGVATYTQI
jgi:hypothetical protein